MIGHLRGKLLSKEPPVATIETGGVGYVVEVPLSTYYKLPQPGSEVAIHIHTYVRDDAIILFGFSTTGERHLFRRLITISGIGPKLALTIIGAMGPGDFLTAIDITNYAKLMQIPGIGRKTAERLVLEMKDKVAELRSLLGLDATEILAAGGTLKMDIVSALENLGYKRRNAEKAAELALARLGDEVELETLLKEALAKLMN